MTYISITRSDEFLYDFFHNLRCTQSAQNKKPSLIKVHSPHSSIIMESNLAEEWKKVGFGWTNKSTNHLITSSTKVSFLIDPQIIHFNNFYEEFPSKSFHDYLLEQFTTFPFHDSHKFQQIIQYFLQQYFIVEKSQFLSHYNDFLLHEGRSNERQLRWDIMYIPANLSFNLHAHPNIEIIWVLSGTIHEYRLVNNTNPTDFVQVRLLSLIHHIITYLSYLLLNP